MAGAKPGVDFHINNFFFCCIRIHMGGDHQEVSPQARGTGSQPWMPSSSTLHFYLLPTRELILIWLAACSEGPPPLSPECWDERPLSCPPAFMWDLGLRAQIFMLL